MWPSQVITRLKQFVQSQSLVQPFDKNYLLNVNVNVVYALKQKFSEEGVGMCEEMGLQPISELFTTDGG